MLLKFAADGVAKVDDDTRNISAIHFQCLASLPKCILDKLICAFLCLEDAAGSYSKQMVGPSVEIVLVNVSVFEFNDKLHNFF